MFFCFENGGDPELFLGSADWMTRNLERRVEVVTPIKDPRLRSWLKEEMLAVYLRDNAKARRLLPDGSYERVRPLPGEGVVDAQRHFADRHPA